jgi:L-amino acid N-acyltransferase YncA
VYSDFIDKHNVPYNAEPVSMVDLQQRMVGVDEHGHPQHVLLAKKD